MSKKVEALGTDFDTERVLADRKKCQKYDQCGLGEEFLYFGSTMHPRHYYIPYGEVKRVYKRVSGSDLAGKGFLAPVLYLVVEYGDGKERQCSFRYLQDCDAMQNELERTHPEISQLSPKGEEKKREREEIEARMACNELSEKARAAQKQLEEARWEVHKHQAMSDKMAAMAKLKRHADLFRPWVGAVAVTVLAAGGVVTAAGAVFIRRGSRMAGLLMVLFGIMMMFTMVSSRALPSKLTNRKRRDREYQEAVEAMGRALKGYRGLPIPVWYAHPVVFDRLIRILQEMRAETVDEALAVLKEDLRAMDNTTVLSKEDYEEVVKIKPLFTVRNYQ